MTTEPVVFVDCESTGLNPDLHEMWELAIIADEKAYVWQLPVDLARADPMGLRVGRFYERRRQIAGIGSIAKLHRVRWPSSAEWENVGLPVNDTAETVAYLLDGNHIVGAIPSFDANFLTRWLNAHGQAATWHHHLIDVEALAVGYLKGTAAGARSPEEEYNVTLPWRSDDLTAALGLAPVPADERHTALGDALWAKRIYEKVMLS